MIQHSYSRSALATEKFLLTSVSRISVRHCHTGYFQDGRYRKTHGEVDGHSERPRGIRNILAFQWPGFWYRGAYLLPLQSLVQSFQRRKQQVTRISSSTRVLVTRDVAPSPMRRTREIQISSRQNPNYPFASAPGTVRPTRDVTTTREQNA